MTNLPLIEHIAKKNKPMIVSTGMSTLEEIDETVKLIYGGSVSPDNSSEILNTSIVDGALVGGASLDADKFVDIIKSVNL